MTPTDDLFALIKSLSKSEKRYFKLSTSLHSGKENAYTKLFDAIEKQSNYDEAAIKKQFPEGYFTTQFPVAKNYLYNLILKSLRNFYSGKTLSLEIRELIDHIEVLHQKGLYKQCQKVLEKAKKLAEKHEKFELMTELIRWEEILLYKKLGNKRVLEFVRALQEEKRINAEKLENLNWYREVYYETSIAMRQHGLVRDMKYFLVKGVKYFSELKTIMQHPLFKNEDCALSQTAKFWYSMMYSIYAIHTNGEYWKAYHLTRKYFHYIETQTEIKNEISLLYLDALYFFSDICVKIGKEKEEMETLRKFKNIPVQSLDMRAAVFERYYALYTDKCLRTGNFKEGVAIIDEINEGLEKYDKQLNKLYKIFIYINTAINCFGVAKYKDSLIWINKLLNDSKLKVREDILAFARILNLLIHVELGNYETTEYLLRSTKYYLNKKNLLSEVGLVMLDFSRKVLRANTEPKLHKVYTDLHTKLVKLKNDPKEKAAFENFDYLLWVESKLQKKPFEQIYHKRKNHNLK